MIYERNYGIELLRIVLMFMVCMLHVLGQGGILNSFAVGTPGYRTFWLMEILGYCAVDGFALISGYMAVNKPKKYEKLAEMWFQAFFYSFVITVILAFAGLADGWGTIDFVKCAFPITFQKFWYLTAFFLLFLATPILNKFLFSLDKRASGKAFIIMIILFSIMGTLADPFITNAGYSALWLIALYCIGVLAKRIELFEKVKSTTLVIIWAVSIALTWTVHAFIENGILTNYVSPTILLCGMIMVVLFSRIRTSGKVIARVAPLTFGIYLFQLNPLIWSNFLYNRFAFAAGIPLPLGIACVITCALALFVTGLFVEFLRYKIAKAIRIPSLSRKIVAVIGRALDAVASR